MASVGQLKLLLSLAPSPQIYYQVFSIFHGTLHPSPIQ